VHDRATRLLPVIIVVYIGALLWVALTGWPTKAATSAGIASKRRQVERNRARVINP
jgi:hypothetical protein